MFIHSSAAGHGRDTMICVTVTEESDDGRTAVTSTVRMDLDACRQLHSQIDKLLLDLVFEEHGIEPGEAAQAREDVGLENLEDEYLARFDNEPF